MKMRIVCIRSRSTFSNIAISVFSWVALHLIISLFFVTHHFHHLCNLFLVFFFLFHFFPLLPNYVIHLPTHSPPIFSSLGLFIFCSLECPCSWLSLILFCPCIHSFILLNFSLSFTVFVDCSQRYIKQMFSHPITHHWYNFFITFSITHPAVVAWR